MTDKQIIIDGCDVSGCEWCKEVGLDSEYICTCNSSKKVSGYCKDNPNCYYKQLKHEEQECEEFRKTNDEKNELLAKLGCPTIATAKRKVFCLQEQLDQLKAENERLEAHSATLDAVIETGRVQYKALKQTLADIKPIVEFYSNSKLGVEQPNGTYSMEIKDDKVIGGTYTITYNPNPAKTALDKINEVI